MPKVDAYHDSDSGYLGSADVHTEKWRVHGNEAQMVDTSKYGPLSQATDDSNVNTCKKAKWPNAPGFDDGVIDACESGSLSGAMDGAASNKNERGEWEK